MDQKSQPPLCQLDLGFPSMAGRFLWTQLPAWSNEDHAGNQRIERLVKISHDDESTLISLAGRDLTCV